MSAVVQGEGGRGSASVETITAGELPAPHVVEALRRVMRDLPGIGKGDTSGQGYNYRGIEAVTREVQPLLARHGVVFVPQVIDRTEVDLTIGGKPWTEQRLTVAYAVYGPGGIDDRIDVGPIVAQGRDNSDKGCNKAMTQAFKYALLQTLCICDGKDDADRQTHEADAPVVVWDRGMVKTELLNTLGGDKTAAAAAWEWASGDSLDEWSAAVAHRIASGWRERSQETGSGDAPAESPETLTQPSSGQSADPGLASPPIIPGETEALTMGYGTAKPESQPTLLNGAPYDPKAPPSDVLEAAIDRAGAIPDNELTLALIAVGQDRTAHLKADTKRRRLVEAWLAAGWLPDAGTTAE